MKAERTKPLVQTLVVTQGPQRPVSAPKTKPQAEAVKRQVRVDVDVVEATQSPSTPLTHSPPAREGEVQQSAILTRINALPPRKDKKTEITPGSHPEWFWLCASSNQLERKWKAPPPGVDVVVNSNNSDGHGWIEKWVSPSSGKTVHNYTEAEMARRAGQKFVDNVAFALNIDRLRQQLSLDLSSRDPKVRTTALVIAIIDHTYIRVGNKQSTARSTSNSVNQPEKQDTYGITTMLAGHWRPATGVFEFVGKSEVAHKKAITDAQLKHLVDQAAQGRKDDEPLFVVGDRQITASDVNAWLAPWGATAKKFRTYHATRLAFDELRRWGFEQRSANEVPTATTRAAAVDRVVASIADQIGHDAATCQKHYIDPALLELFLLAKLPTEWP